MDSESTMPSRAEWRRWGTSGKLSVSFFKNLDKNASPKVQIRRTTSPAVPARITWFRQFYIVHPSSRASFASFLLLRKNLKDATGTEGCIVIVYYIWYSHIWCSRLFWSDEDEPFCEPLRSPRANVGKMPRRLGSLWSSATNPPIKMRDKKTRK